MTNRPPTNCPNCGSDDTETVPGHPAHTNRARTPRTVICFDCGHIAELQPGDNGHHRWVGVTG